mmetsp:Transcript_7691/g.23999  ORF Transcript_7691/g.23999 Transcript_7691/m.23999 type:complete len:445 (+) Transcript_7691:619-1953(+)
MVPSASPQARCAKYLPRHEPTKATDAEEARRGGMIKNESAKGTEAGDARNGSRRSDDGRRPGGGVGVAAGAQFLLARLEACFSLGPELLHHLALLLLLLELLLLADGQAVHRGELAVGGRASGAGSAGGGDRRRHVSEVNLQWPRDLSDRLFQTDRLHRGGRLRHRAQNVLRERLEDRLGRLALLVRAGGDAHLERVVADRCIRCADNHRVLEHAFAGLDGGRGGRAVQVGHDVGVLLLHPLGDLRRVVLEARRAAVHRLVLALHGVLAVLASVIATIGGAIDVLGELDALRRRPGRALVVVVVGVRRVRGRLGLEHRLVDLGHVVAQNRHGALPIVVVLVGVLLLDLLQLRLVARREVRIVGDVARRRAVDGVGAAAHHGACLRRGEADRARVGCRVAASPAGGRRRLTTLQVAKLAALVDGGGLLLLLQVELRRERRAARRR